MSTTLHKYNSIKLIKFLFQGRTHLPRPIYLWFCGWCCVHYSGHVHQWGVLRSDSRTIRLLLRYDASFWNFIRLHSYCIVFIILGFKFVHAHTNNLFVHFLLDAWIAIVFSQTKKAVGGNWFNKVFIELLVWYWGNMIL